MKDNLIIASKLLSDFNNFLEKRSALFVTHLEEFLNSALQWHFQMWEKEQELLGQDKKLDEWSMYSDLSRTINSIVQKIELLGLKNKASSLLLKKLDQQTDRYKKTSISSRYYVEYLLDTFYQVFFQEIYGSSDRYNIWNSYFPEKWKVTKNNLESSDNILSKISLKNFLEWASDRIWRASDDNDFPLHDISTNLFPEVDPILWSKILIFVFSPYSENRLQSVIERPWNFGFAGRVKAYNASEENEIIRMHRDEEIKTYELSYLLFKDQFSIVNLEKYLITLEQLSYSKDSKEERKRTRLYSLFTDLLKFVKASDSGQS